MRRDLPPPADPAPEERAFLDELAHWQREETGYQWIQGTNPQTLAYGLTDSPVGLAAWIIEKFRTWSDCDGDVNRRFGKDVLLTNVMLYWVTGAINSSFWPYYARFHGPWPIPDGQRISVPTGYAEFPREILHPPRQMAERMYNIQRWTRDGARRPFRRSRRAGGPRRRYPRLLPGSPVMKFCYRMALITVLTLSVYITGPMRAEELPPQPTTVQHTHPTADLSVFEEVWRTVRDQFYDPTLRGLDWAAVEQRYRPMAAAAGSEAERSAVINRMLSELAASHTRHYTASDPAYFQLLDIFSGALRRPLQRLFPDGQVTYPGIGIFTRQLDSQTFIAGIIDGLSAQKAGLVVGDEILAADGKPFHPIDSFAAKVGQEVTMTIRRRANDPAEDVVVVPERIKPNEAFLKAMERKRPDHRRRRRQDRLHPRLVLRRHTVPAAAGARGVVGQTEGCRRPGVGLARRVGWRRDGVPLHLQRSGTDHDPDQPRRPQIHRKRHLAEAGRYARQWRHTQREGDPRLRFQRVWHR